MNSILFSILSSIFFSLALQAQTPQTVKSKNYSIPLHFDLVGQGVELPPLQFKYDLETSEGEKLVLNDQITISPENLYIDLLQLPKIDETTNKSTNEHLLFLFQWPEYVMEEGQLEFISKTGRILWRTPIEKNELTEWSSQKIDFEKKRLKLANKIETPSLLKIQYGLDLNPTNKNIFMKLTEPFRICFSRQITKNLSRLCTSMYEIERTDQILKFSLTRLSEVKQRVIFMNKSESLKGDYSVVPGKSIQFYAELKSGISYEFNATPQKIEIIDIYKKTNTVVLSLKSDQRPLQKAKLMKAEEGNDFIEWLIWYRNNGDQTQVWQTETSVENPSVLLRGVGGGVFQQRFIITKLPTEDLRPYIKTNTIQGTYINGALIEGRKKKLSKVSSKQLSIEINKEISADHFQWEFQAEKKGAFNKSYLIVSDGTNTFPAYYDLYKGFSSRLSTRMTALSGADDTGGALGSFTFLGEVDFTHWFETVFGWNNDLFSIQRWGTTVKSFRSFTDIQHDFQFSPLIVHTLEMKYRLNPGLTDRDTTWGLLTGYQNISLAPFNAELLGVGVFWSGSIPEFLDSTLNIIPFLNYPKWMNVEFMYYMNSMNNNIKLQTNGGSNLTLDIQGQIMFTDSWFGELGLGLKQFDFTDTSAIDVFGKNPNISFLSSYGTFGIGYRF